MLKQPCPSCKNQISLKERLSLVYKFHGTCKLCNNNYMVNTKAMITSSAVLGTITGITGAAVFKFDSISIFILSFSVVLVVQSFVNLFYSLIPIDKSHM